MTIEIEIDRDQCMGSGNCVFTAPGVFELDGEGIATVVDVEAQPSDVVVRAGQGCPTRAIAVTRDGERVV